MAATEGRLTNRSRLPGHALRLHRPVVPLLRDLLERTGSDRIVDLCSGRSGPLLDVVRELRESGLDVEVLLTDRYPNRPASDEAPERRMI